jgi:hypothetical protein
VSDPDAIHSAVPDAIYSAVSDAIYSAVPDANHSQSDIDKTQENRGENLYDYAGGADHLALNTPSSPCNPQGHRAPPKPAQRPISHLHSSRPPSRQGSVRPHLPPSPQGSAQLHLPPSRHGSVQPHFPPDRQGSAQPHFPPDRQDSAQPHFPPDRQGSAQPHFPPDRQDSVQPHFPPDRQGSVQLPLPPSRQGSAQPQRHHSRQGSTQPSTHSRRSSVNPPSTIFDTMNQYEPEDEVLIYDQDDIGEEEVHSNLSRKRSYTNFVQSSDGESSSETQLMKAKRTPQVPIRPPWDAGTIAGPSSGTRSRVCRETPMIVMTDATPAPGASGSGHTSALDHNVQIRKLDFLRPRTRQKGY